MSRLLGQANQVPCCWAWLEETHSASGNGAGPAPPSRGERVPLDTPAHNAFGHDPDPRISPALSELLGAARVVELGGAAHLDPARSPRVGAGEIDDHDRDLWVGLQIAVLLRLGEVAAADVDRGAIFSEAEADRDHVRRVVRVCGREAREPLALEVLEFFVGEGSHRWLVGSWLGSGGNVRGCLQPRLVVCLKAVDRAGVGACAHTNDLVAAPNDEESSRPETSSLPQSRERSARLCLPAKAVSVSRSPGPGHLDSLHDARMFLDQELH